MERAIKLDTTSLGNAVRRLREGLARYEREPTDEQIRDGLIQRFEFTYELSHKMIRRYLREAAASPDEIERVPFADLIRTANVHGLLRGDWPAWRRFREMRARTSHPYDAEVASQVAAAIPAFLEEAEHLYAELQRRLARAALCTSTCRRITGGWCSISFTRSCRGALKHGCSARGRPAGRGAIPISIWRSTPAGD
jgi:nucleotidyltransferase substrate binding protein (TIGR01987 family)